MLARSFLTADQLDIPQDWHDALVLVLRAMERGEFKHLPEVNVVEAPSYDEDLDPRLFLGRFNMNFWQENVDCGTVCCIGGAAEILGNIKFTYKCDALPELENLFYPEHKGDEDSGNDFYCSITVAQAQRALQNYLTTGESRWQDILCD